MARSSSRWGLSARAASGRSPWQALVRSVAYQQLNGTAAETIFKRFLALFPGQKFPSPEQIVAAPDERLRSAGLSRAKTAAIKDIAAHTIAGIVPERRAFAKLSDAEIIERLTVIRGVGPWTVEMLLMFTLGRLDVLPATDFGVRSGFALVYGLKELPAPKTSLRMVNGGVPIVRWRRGICGARLTFPRNGRNDRRPAASILFAGSIICGHRAAHVWRREREFQRLVIATVLLGVWSFTGYRIGRRGADFFSSAVCWALASVTWHCIKPCRDSVPGWRCCSTNVWPRRSP